MIAVGAISAPLATPVLPVETYIRYTRALHLSPPASETHKHYRMVAVRPPRDWENARSVTPRSSTSADKSG
jgi:hypothetical protein